MHFTEGPPFLSVVSGRFHLNYKSHQPFAREDANFARGRGAGHPHVSATGRPLPQRPRPQNPRGPGWPTPGLLDRSGRGWGRIFRRAPGKPGRRGGRKPSSKDFRQARNTPFNQVNVEDAAFAGMRKSPRPASAPRAPTKLGRALGGGPAPPCSVPGPRRRQPRPAPRSPGRWRRRGRACGALRRRLYRRPRART